MADAAPILDVVRMLPACSGKIAQPRRFLPREVCKVSGEFEVDVSSPDKDLLILGVASR